MTCCTQLDGKVLSSDVTHYVVPDGGVVRDFLEILEFRELQGIVFTQTANQHTRGRRSIHGTVFIKLLLLYCTNNLDLIGQVCFLMLNFLNVVILSHTGTTIDCVLCLKTLAMIVCYSPMSFSRTATAPETMESLRKNGIQGESSRNLSSHI